MAELRRHVPTSFIPLYKPSPFKAFFGGRGGGKSHNIAEALLSMGVERKLRILCTREIQKSISTSVYQLLLDKIEAMGLQSHYRVLRDTIIGRNGTQFLFMGMRTNPDSIKSTEGIDICWIEEAHTVSQASLDILFPTIRKPGSEIWFSWNRRFATDPVDNLFLGGDPPPGSIVRKVNSYHNPFFPAGLKIQMEWMKKRDYEKYLHVWEGELVQRSDTKVFKHWRHDDLDDLVSDLTPRLGADWGFSVDPSVLVECFILPEERILYFRDEAWKVGAELDELPSLFAGSDHLDPPRWRNPFKPGAERHPGIASSKHFRITADSSRPDTISYMRNRGFDIFSAKKGPGSIHEGVEFMRSFDIVLHPTRVPHVEDEMNTYSYKVDPLTDEVLGDLEDKKNHTIDACRYGVENVRRHQPQDVSMGAELIDGGYVDGGGSIYDGESPY